MQRNGFLRRNMPKGTMNISHKNIRQLGYEALEVNIVKIIKLQYSARHFPHIL